MNPSELNELLLTSASDVLASMYFADVMGPPQNPVIEPGFWATLGFKGEISGTFSLSLSKDTARKLAANFFGEEESDVSEEAVADMVGEMANMVCGSVLSRMTREVHFKLTHPVVAIGEDDEEEVTEGMTCQLLETDSGVLKICLKAE